MCYAIPGRVVEIKGRIAVVDYFGEHRNVLNDFIDLKQGDYVYAQGGIVVEKVSEKYAKQILDYWKDKFFQLKRVDQKISERKGKPNPKLKNIFEKAEKGSILNRSEILELIRMENKNEMETLFKFANGLRQRYLKNASCVHGIIEFSNYCISNCAYCGIRKDNKKLIRYRMDIDEIVQIAEHAVNDLSFKALVLQSGEDPWYTTEKLVEIIKRVRKKCGVLLFMSIGTRSFNCYKKMYEAGARGVLIRFETSNPDLYKNLHINSKSDFNKRLELIKYTKKLGYVVATGFLIGLPGQTEEDLINDVMLTKSLNPDMYSFGPFIPHPETPLSKAKTVDIETVLKVIAVCRLLDPNAKILVTTALETLDKKNGKRLGLLSGANSLMINITPERYKKLYSIYPNRAGIDKSVKENIDETLELLYSLGRAPTDLGI